MDRKAAKELLHVQAWLARGDEIIERGKGRYLADDLLQEAGDSLVMKVRAGADGARLASHVARESRPSARRQLKPA